MKWSTKGTQTCIPPTFMLAQETGRNDTTKYMMIGRIRDEEGRGGKTGEERRGGHMLSGWTSREGREGGTTGKNHTHTHTNAHVSLPSAALATLPVIPSNQNSPTLFPPYF